MTEEVETEEVETEDKFDKMAAIDALEEITIDMQDACKRFTEQEFRRFKGLMQIYFRNW